MKRDMDVNEHNYNKTYKSKQRNSTFIAVLHFTVTCVHTWIYEVAPPPPPPPPLWWYSIFWLNPAIFVCSYQPRTLILSTYIVHIVSLCSVICGERMFVLFILVEYIVKLLLKLHNSWLCNKSNTMGATCGTGTAYPSGAPLILVEFVLLNL